MTEVISVKFKNRGKVYFFDPHGIAVRTGDKVVVETSRGLELAECVLGNHVVPDETVVQPLRSLARIATKDDLRIEEINRRREKEAFQICKQKIAEHGLDMKLVDVECSFEGNKTMFFFTSDGRVDFRELVKDLASVFRNRIELRQIGVRDEAKMLGGIGICGRPYCCSQFLDDFQPVSTKMAKVQSMSLNPSKISGACGRLMCCLRYEQAAYEDLVKAVPKVGAFVETPAGYGTVSSVNILRSSLKVKLDGQGARSRANRCRRCSRIGRSRCAMRSRRKTRGRCRSCLRMMSTVTRSPMARAPSRARRKSVRAAAPAVTAGRSLPMRRPPRRRSTPQRRARRTVRRRAQSPSSRSARSRSPTASPAHASPVINRQVSIRSAAARKLRRLSRPTALRRAAKSARTITAAGIAAAVDATSPQRPAMPSPAIPRPTRRRQNENTNRCIPICECQKVLLFDKGVAACCAHNLSAGGAQIPHLQPERYFLRRACRRRK